ncbi:MAG: HAD-IC family P-type ATPase, partial [Candidatus Sungiibacteriota bacterium]
VTGNNTEFGKIAALVAERKPEPTPLQRAVSRFAKMTGIVLVVLTVILFGIGVYVGYDLFDMFLIAVAVAVSAVPEGLPVALTVILAIGVERLAKQKGVVRKLLAAETLGSTNLILTDKTGTLTQAKMELVEILPWQDRRSEAARKQMVATALLNTDVVVENPDSPPGQWQIVGGPLEIALVKGAVAEGVSYPEIQRTVEIVDRKPFTSQAKYSISISYRQAKHYVSILGAPEIIIDFTDLGDEEKKRVRTQIAERAHSGERILGLAAKEQMRSGETIRDHVSLSGFRFLGLLAFRDPLRPTVKAAIRHIGERGVKTVIVTGDHPGTAEAVGREAGIVHGPGEVMTGEELSALSDEEVVARAGHISAYARTTPEQKVRLITMYKKLGYVVAATGDGINDAPALEAADIGVAVGSGTDVTKSAADLVILDDNFETIVTAIKGGRRILQNIRKVIVYLLSSSLDEVLLIGGSLLAGLALPLNALQILFVNFFSDSFPAVAFAFEHMADEGKERPVQLHKNLFDPAMKFFILVIGIPTSALLFFIYHMLLSYGLHAETVRTFIFASFASYTLFLAFS